LDLLNEIKSLSRAVGVTLVLVSHDPFEAKTVCSEIIVMESGQIVEKGPSEAIFRSSQSKIIQFYRLQN
jgi:ABC-type glutathione transport system ATPase component